MSQDSDTELEHAPPGGKVISLRSHQAAEQLLDDLSRITRHSRDYDRLVSKAADLGPPVLAAIQRHLDPSRPLQLLLLGDIVLAYSPHSHAVEALTRTASDRRNSDSRRIGAVIVLCNHDLQPPLVEELFTSLRSPTGTIAHALVSILGAHPGEAEPLVEFSGFIGALLSQPVDLLYAVVNKLAETGGDGAVHALRLLALHPHPELMEAAIEALASRASASAVMALTSLSPNLPAEATHSARRLLHKLRLTGIYDDKLTPLPDADCRALVSAIDGRGRRMVWLRVPVAPASRQFASLGLMTSDYAGLIEALAPGGSYPPGAPMLPSSAPIGTVHQPLVYKLQDAPPNLATVTCVEVPFSYGLKILRKAVSRNWVSGTPLPLEYHLLFHLVWQYGSDEGEEDGLLSRYVDRTGQSLAENESELLSNPLFESWFLESEGVRLVAEEVAMLDSAFPHELTDDSWRVLLPSIIRLAHDEFSTELRMRYANRLRLMSEWLRYAALHRDAELAASAAQTIIQSPPEANLFVLRLVQKGILVTLSDLTFSRH